MKEFKELEECLAMLDSLILPGGWGNEARSMDRAEIEKLKAWMVAITLRVEDLEAPEKLRERIKELETELREDRAVLIRQIQLADKEIKKRDEDVSKLHGVIERQNTMIGILSEKLQEPIDVSDLVALSDERWEPLADGYINCSFGDAESQLQIKDNGTRLQAKSYDVYVDLAFGGLRVCRKVEAVKDEVNA